jgi:hypothetical protein
MTAAEQYIDRVVNRIPHGMPLREQVALELRALIAERLERGQSIEQILLQLGNPDVLADSYLSALPLVNATFWPRVAAKLIDWIAVWTVVGFVVGIGVVAAMLLVGSTESQDDTRGLLLFLAIAACILALVLVMPTYFAITEYMWYVSLAVRSVSVSRLSGSCRCSCRCGSST